MPKPVHALTSAQKAAKARPYVMSVLNEHGIDLRTMTTKDLTSDGFPTGQYKHLRKECMERRNRKGGYSPKDRRDQRVQNTPATPEDRILTGAICGSPRRNAEGPCCMPAGWGTDHQGRGPCKYHGGATKGNTQHHLLQEVREKAIMYGAPRDISPEDAIKEELMRTAGHVAWLGEQIRALQDPKQLSQLTASGYKPSALMDMYDKERANLVRVAKIAIDSGFREREVQLAEDQGRMIAMVLQSFVRDPELGLTPAQLVAARPLMRKHLLAIDVASVSTTTERQPDESGNAGSGSG